jgi:hypothetical protein
MVESSQRMIGEQNHNLTVKKHFELQIKEPRDAKNKLQALLRLKEREKTKKQCI